MLTFEEFERGACARIVSDSYPSGCVVQENALRAETLSTFVWLLVCARLGIVETYE